jgi:hypothetical protein
VVWLQKTSDELNNGHIFRTMTKVNCSCSGTRPDSVCAVVFGRWWGTLAILVLVSATCIRGRGGGEDRSEPDQHIEVCKIDFPKPEILINCRASLLVQTPRSTQPEQRKSEGLKLKREILVHPRNTWKMALPDGGREYVELEVVTQCRSFLICILYPVSLECSIPTRKREARSAWTT